MEELEKILLSDNVIENINNSNIFNIIPDLKYMVNFDQKNINHHLDLWNHTLLAISLAPKDFEIRLVLLLHDIGKPFCYQDADMRHFKGHAIMSCNLSKIILDKLKIDKELENEILLLIKEHDNPITKITDKEIIRKKFIVQTCDALAHNPEKLNKKTDYLKKVSFLLHEEEFLQKTLFKIKK